MLQNGKFTTKSIIYYIKIFSEKDHNAMEYDRQKITEFEYNLKTTKF